jgi:putative hydrolase of the HAD superfamily
MTFWLKTGAVVDHDVLGYAKKLRAAGVGCHLGSNQEKIRSSYLWNVFGLSNHFDSAFFSCDMRCVKPCPQFYEKICASLRVQPNEIVLLDDVQENVVAAQQCGWRGLLWPGPETIDF